MIAESFLNTLMFNAFHGSSVCAALEKMKRHFPEQDDMARCGRPSDINLGIGTFVRTRTIVLVKIVVKPPVQTLGL